MPLDPAALPWTKLADGMRLSPGGPVFRKASAGSAALAEGKE